MVKLVRSWSALLGVVAASGGACSLLESQGSFQIYGPDAAATGDAGHRRDAGKDGTARVDADPGDGGAVRDVGVAHDAAGDAGIVTLATGEMEPEGIVHVGGTVYWANYASKALRALTAGGTPRTLATTASGPTELLTDEAYLYAVVGSSFADGTAPRGACSDYVWMPLLFDGGGALQCGNGNGAWLDGGVIGTSGNLARCSDIAVASMQVFEVKQAFFDYDGTTTTAPGGVSAWTGNEILYAATSPDPGAVATDGVTLYAAFGSAIWQQSASLNDTGALFYQSAPSDVVIEDIAVDSLHVYWVSSDGTLRRALKDKGASGTSDLVASNLAMPWRLTLYEGYVYWTNRGGSTGPGSLQRISAAATSPTAATLATGENLPYGIFVDFTGVYWTSAGDGTVKMLPLP
jgi:hypothetical protein